MSNGRYQEALKVMKATLKPVMMSQPVCHVLTV